MLFFSTIIAVIFLFFFYTKVYRFFFLYTLYSMLGAISSEKKLQRFFGFFFAFLPMAFAKTSKHYSALQ